MAHNLRRESLEQRQELEAHLGAQEASLPIRGVLGELELMAAQVQCDIRLSRPALGADPAPAAWRQHGQARWPRAAQQAQKYGLGAVVGVMRRGNQLCAQALSRRRKRGTPR